jgi:hypothetical protein
MLEKCCYVRSDLCPFPNSLWPRAGFELVCWRFGAGVVVVVLLSRQRDAAYFLAIPPSRPEKPPFARPTS